MITRVPPKTYVEKHWSKLIMISFLRCYHWIGILKEKNNFFFWYLGWNLILSDIPGSRKNLRVYAYTFSDFLFACLEAPPGSAQGLLQTLCSGVTAGRLGGPYGVLGTESGQLQPKQVPLPAVLLLWSLSDSSEPNAFF